MDSETFTELFRKVCTIIVVRYVVISIIKFLYTNFLAPALKINAVDLAKTGQWAVVTGATDGIGKAYAEALAKKNLNVVLISRTQSKLDAVEANIQKNYNVKTKTIAVDFTSVDDIYKTIDKQLQGLDIGVLINNVGMFFSYPEYFLDVQNKDEIYENLIRCNISSVVNMCKIVLPGMVERKRGVIVNLSSVTAIIPFPLVSVYSGSKAFVKKFSEDLSTEYKKNGITIQCLVTGPVATNMTGIKNPTWLVPSADKYVESAIATVGIREVTTGYFPHTLIAGGLNFLNSIFPRLAKWIIMRAQLGARSKALKKQ